MKDIKSDSQPSFDMKDAQNRRLELRADCERCFGLCCVALPFAQSIDFAIDKVAGQPCPNLREDHRCGIHQRLRNEGFRGCTVYDCMGAGQKISQVTYGGRDWRQHPDTARPMFDILPMMRQLQEFMWYLTEALTYTSVHAHAASSGESPDIALGEALHEALIRTDKLTMLPPEALLELDVAAHRAGINELLLQTSQLVREGALRAFAIPAKRRKSYGRGADLAGAKLHGTDLRCANLRGAWLIAADLRGADMRYTDLIGADFRDADIRGADLTTALFLTQSQLGAAKGDDATRIPSSLARPSHWLDQATASS